MRPYAPYNWRIGRTLRLVSLFATHGRDGDTCSVCFRLFQIAQGLSRTAIVAISIPDRIVRIQIARTRGAPVSITAKTHGLRHHRSFNHPLAFQGYASQCAPCREANGFGDMSAGCKRTP